MHIQLIGLNHKTAPVQIREMVYFTKEQLPNALLELYARVGEVVILSTCNRIEIFCITRRPEVTRQEITGFMSQTHGISPETIQPYLYEFTGDDAVEHLFRVASGMDSLVLGESQIMGQIREAYGIAIDTGTVHENLSSLFHRALRAGKKVRQETGIGRYALSVSYVCVELARQTLTNLKKSEALLIGAGEAGKLASQALVKGGVRKLSIANRTYSRAKTLADELGGHAMPFDEIEDALTEANIVICATGANTNSEGYVLALNTISSAMERRGSDPMFLMDISVPRSIAPEVANIQGLTLYNIDDLKTVSQSNRQEREAEAQHAEVIIKEELHRYLSQWNSLEVNSTVSAIHRQAEDIRLRTVSRTLSALHDLTEEQQEQIQELSRILVKKMLHHPVTALKDTGDLSDAQALRRLFKLDAPSA